VERGGEPGETCRPIIDTFLKWSRTIETSPNGNDDIVRPAPDAGVLTGLQLLGQAIVAHVARLPDVRKWMRDTPEIRGEFDRVAHLSVGASWVLQLLTQCSGELVVLNTAKKIGVQVRYSNISNCFHLFTLLQGALAGVMPDAKKVNPITHAIALGTNHGTCSDEAWWHYGQPSVSTQAIAGMVWGEMTPSGIARVDGEQVLLLCPPILKNRAWDAGFFTPILEATPPKVELLKLLQDMEVNAWWKKLQLAEPQNSARASWWRTPFRSGSS
jgi:hypothetical protein